MKRVTGRDFKVTYYEKEQGEPEVWIVESWLQDEAHDICVTVAIGMAQIKFNRFPLDHCCLIAAKASQMKGLKVDHEFSRNVMKLFMGPEGCPNIMSLLTISVPGIIYYYYPHKIKTGKMKSEEWDNLVRTELNNACLAHTML